MQETGHSVDLELHSDGGSFRRAMSMHAHILLHGHVHTDVHTVCASACTLVWSAGQAHTLGPQAVLVFHGSSVYVPPYFSPNRRMAYVHSLPKSDRAEIESSTRLSEATIATDVPALGVLLHHAHAFDLTGTSGVEVFPADPRLIQALAVHSRTPGAPLLAWFAKTRTDAQPSGPIVCYTADGQPYDRCTTAVQRVVSARQPTIEAMHRPRVPHSVVQPLVPR